MKHAVKDGRLVYECGCSFDIVGPPVLSLGGMPALKFEPDLHKPDHDVNFGCEATWDLIGTGRTLSIFQLEKPLGKQWAAKLRPRSIEHMAALGALLRPGCLKALDAEGISMTEHYCRRKNGEEATTYFHPTLENALSKTYGILVFQENALQICRDVAGFSDQEADDLRRAIGKKKPEEMARSKTLFLKKATELGKVTAEEAATIFDWIEKGQRYLFVKAHATAYAIAGYITAYIKTHFPLQHFAAALAYAQDGQDAYDEIKAVALDARLMGAKVCPPLLRFGKNHFHSDGEKIYFGISDIRGIGETVLDKFDLWMEEAGITLDADWITFLIKVLDRAPSTVANALIEVGALEFPLTRKRMLVEYDIWHNKLTDKEKEWIITQREKQEDAPLEILLQTAAKPRKEGGGCATKKRVEVVGSLLRTLSDPPYPLTDTPDWIISVEKDRLGVALSFGELSKYAVNRATHVCKDISDGFKKYAVLAVRLFRVSVVKTKRGKNPGREMAFLGVSDNTELENVVVFPDVFAEAKDLLSEGNVVFIAGALDKGSFKVEKVYAI